MSLFLDTKQNPRKPLEYQIEGKPDVNLPPYVNEVTANSIHKKTPSKRDQELETMQRELLQQKALIQAQQSVISNLKSSALKGASPNKELEHHRELLSAIYQFSKHPIQLKKGIDPKKSHILFILNKESLIHWNQNTGMVSLSAETKDFLQNHSHTVPLHIFIAKLSSYIDDNALGKWVSSLDFATLNIEEEKLLLKEILTLKSLEKLKLNNCQALNSEWFIRFNQGCPKVKQLIFLGCENLKLESLMRLKGSKNITLSINETQHIHAHEWNALAKTFPNFHVQIEKVRFMINQLTPNKLLYQGIVNCPEHPSLFELALLRGANINELCKDESSFRGKNALHIAVQYNLLTPLKFFVKHGGNITIKDYKNQTPLARALSSNYKDSHNDVIEYLLSFGAV